jgi:hypothetical protein
MGVRMNQQASAAPANPSPTERLTKQFTLLGSVIGIFVTVNAVIVGCSNTAVSRANDYRAAVGQEEEFWSKLYDKYLAAIATDDDEAQRRKKLMAIALLATHDTPSFEEYRPWYLSNEGPDPAAVSIDKMRQVLFDALTDETVSSPATAQEIAFFLDEKASIRERAARDEGDAPPETPPQVTAGAERRTEVAQVAQTADAVVLPAASGTLLEPVVGSTILTAGASDGWDMDVFWCMGEDDARNYTRAVRVSDALAAAAAGGRPIAAGVKPGRIRLRSLPPSQQQDGFYARQGTSIIWDPGPGEEDAAQATAIFVRSRSGIALKPIRSGGTLTPWYLSVFICGRPQS